MAPRRRLSPEHLAALRAGYERWRRQQREELPHQISTTPRRTNVEAMQEGRRRARAARQARQDRARANLERARAAQQARRQGVVDFEQRAEREMRLRVDTLVSALTAPMERGSTRIFMYPSTHTDDGRVYLDSTVPADNGVYFAGTGEYHYEPESSLSEAVATIASHRNGRERIERVRQDTYRILGDGLHEVLVHIRRVNAEEGRNLVLFASRMGSNRKHRVTPNFVNNAREMIRNERSPYSHGIDWWLNGSDAELANMVTESAPFPPPIMFTLKDIHQPQRNVRAPRRGAWAPWKNRFRALDLRRLQIDTDGESTLTDQDAQEHCFIYALRQSGQVQDAVLRQISLELYGQNTTLSSLRDICSRFSIPVKIRAYTKTSHIMFLGPRGQEPIELGLFDQHYFIDDSLNVSKWVLDHPHEATARGKVNNLGWSYQRVEDEYVADNRPFQRAGTVLRYMKEVGLLTPIRGDDAHALTRRFYRPSILDVDDLNYCQEFCKPIELKGGPKKAPFLWFADFETTTNGECHLPYMLCAMSEDRVQFSTHSYATTHSNSEEIWSHKLNTFIFFIMNHTPSEQEPLVYFHNLNYDMAFIIPFVPIQDKFKVVEINNRILGFRLFHAISNRWIAFRDSYALISAPLRDFGKMFNLHIEKEIFPYEYYTTDNFIVDLNGHETPHPTLEKYLSYYSDPDELRIKLFDLEVEDDGSVDAHLYSRYYCMRDCEVLLEGVMSFRDQLLTVTGLDCTNFMTLPSIAYNFLIKEGVFDDCFNLAGPPLFFIRRCVLGGRCMLQRNQKRDVSGDIADFDAVSLYPSAMARLYTLKGLPKIITGEKCAYSFLTQTDGFFAQIWIRRVGRHLDFPLLAREVDGVMEYCNEPGLYYMDDITLRNVMSSHLVCMEDIEIVRGYYYDNGKNYKIREVINHLFNQRAKLKREGNPLEQAYKLLMNSCYGKSIMKPITEENVVANEEEFNRLIITQGGETMSYKRAGSRYLMTLSKNIVSAQGFPSFGVHILAMSKVIMSEVMVLAQDLDIDVFYTDTDSIHLRTNDIPHLAEMYARFHGRELIGKSLGQFHTDFPNHPLTGNPTSSRRFIGVGKKAYVDELIDRTTGAVCYHMRLKGIPNRIIQATADRDFNGDVIALYECLYAGLPVAFDLLEGRVSFMLNPDLTYTTRSEFTRTVRFSK